MRSLQKNLIRPSSALSAISIFLAFASIWTVGSESREIRPSDHGLANQNNPVDKSPAMAAFFKGAPSDVALPEARNLSDPFWGIAGGVTPATATFGHVRKEGGGHVRLVLLVVSLACGAVGLGLLVAALVVYLLHVKRSKT